MNQQNAWSELAFISIASSGGAEISYMALTEDIDFKRGEHTIDSIPVLNGGRIVKKNPEEATEITFTCYPVDVGGATGGGMAQLFNGTFDTTAPYQSVNSRVRNKYRVSLLWTDDPTVTYATGAIASGSNAYRVYASNSYMTKCVTEFKDKVLKETYTFTVPPYNASGTGNIGYESTDGTIALAALAAFTQS